MYRVRSLKAGECCTEGDWTYCLMFLQMNHSTTGVGCPLAIHTTDWPVAEPWWMSISSTMTAGTVTESDRGDVCKYKKGKKKD